MTTMHYTIVEHDGGWAYTLDGAFSESFPTHNAALNAARRAAHEQQRPDETRVIRWQDAKGDWHEETARGDDRPATDVSG